MNQAEEFERSETGPAESRGPESNRRRIPRDAGTLDSRPLQPVREPVGRPLGPPLPMGSGLKAPAPPNHDEGHVVRSGPPLLGRSLNPRSDDNGGASLAAFRQSMPFLQRLLPLIDGNIASVLSNLVASRPSPPPVVPQIDLQPIETGLTELQGQHRDLRAEIVEHHASLKRVEDHLEMVREATDRNTLEQQELIEDLKAMGSRFNTFALTLVALLVLSVLVNLFLFLHIQRVLP